MAAGLGGTACILEVCVLAEAGLVVGTIADVFRVFPASRQALLRTVSEYSSHCLSENLTWCGRGSSGVGPGGEEQNGGSYEKRIEMHVGLEHGR